MKTETIEARYIRTGDKFIGRREWHVTVEQVIPHSRTLKIEVRGVNGFGEPMTMIYWPKDKVERFIV